MNKNCLLNTLAIFSSAFRTYDLLFLTLNCDLRENPNPKCPKQKRKKCFVNPPNTTLACKELANIVIKKERNNFFLSSKIDQ